jgi:hypothetical protein
VAQLFPFGMKRDPNRQGSTALSRGLRAMLAIALVGSLIGGCAPVGMRLLHMEVYQNDQLVLRTIFDAPDREGLADIWRRAGAEPFASEDQVARVKADEDNPLRAMLAGPVRIKILHVDRLMTSATLTNLVLLRSAPGSLKWYLTPEEVQRAKHAAGL